MVTDLLILMYFVGLIVFSAYVIKKRERIYPECRWLIVFIVILWPTIPVNMFFDWLSDWLIDG